MPGSKLPLSAADGSDVTDLRRDLMWAASFVPPPNPRGALIITAI